jgi:tetratricopeptide (TPR) repeat protein
MTKANVNIPVPLQIVAIHELGRNKEKAEPLFLRAIALDEKALGPESPDLATDLNNLGLLYVFAKRYEDAIKVLGRLRFAGRYMEIQIRW